MECLYEFLVSFARDDLMPTSVYDPSEDERLLPVTIADLDVSGRIRYMDDIEAAIQRHKRVFQSIGRRLTFFVDKSLESAMPLRMILTPGWEPTLIPSGPVLSLTYESSGMMDDIPKYTGIGIVLPEGYSFWNIRRFPGNPLTYFENQESAWRQDNEVITHRALTEFTFRDSRPVHAKTIVEYGRA